MNRKISLGAAIAFMLIVAAATFSATMTYAQTYFNEKSTDLERSREMYMKFTDVDRTVRENYGGEIDEIKLMDSVAQGYITGLGDKYSTYISAEDLKRLQLSKEGEDIGIGAVVTPSPDGYLLISEVYPDSPAQVAGIEAGDLIVKIDDTNITAENVEQAMQLVHGEAGTKLSLLIRKGSQEILIPELTRRIVQIPSVYARIIPDTKVGYVLIKQFNENTADQFTRELHKLTESGASCLIFDVRDNKGATIDSAVRVLDKLVASGTLYSARYKDGTIEEMASSDANEINIPMVTIANGNTSSAAELFVQDLRDFGKANIVGQTTMGKGVILERLKLSDGSAIDLTIATIATKSGAIFDGEGVKPDYDITVDGDWTKLDETTDPQLKKALELVLAMQKVEVTVQAEQEAAASSQASQSSQSSSQSQSQSSSSDASSSDAEPAATPATTADTTSSDDETAGSDTGDDSDSLDKDDAESSSSEASSSSSSSSSS